MSDTKKNASFTELSLGTTGKNVAANIARLREAYKMSFNQLSSKLTDLENPIPPVGLRRIEAQARKVTVDDLFAISNALGVPPIRLLLGNHLAEKHGTAIPEGVHYLEALAWMEGNLDSFSPANRWRFWAKRYNDLTAESKLKEDQLRRSEANAKNTPQDPQTKRVLAFREMSLERTRQSLDDAFDQMERLSLLVDDDAMTGLESGSPSDND